MLATTAAPSHSELGDITTATLCLLKKQVSWNSIILDFSDRRIGYCFSFFFFLLFFFSFFFLFFFFFFFLFFFFGALAHSLYTRNSLDPQDIEAWKYYNN